MPRGCDHAVHVRTVEGRYFIVEFNSDGEPLRIKQRKPKAPPMSGVYDAPYWTASSHGLGGDTMQRRIIAAAREKLRSEHENAKNVP